MRASIGSVISFLSFVNESLQANCSVDKRKVFKRWAYMQTHTPTVAQEEGGTSPYSFWCLSISKRFYLQWKAFNQLEKMGYILWVAALLEAYDVTNNGRYLSRHLGFYQGVELENSGKNDENWYYIGKYFGLLYPQALILWVKEVETNNSFKHCLTTFYLSRHIS